MLLSKLPVRKKVFLGSTILLFLGAAIFGFWEFNGGKFSIRADTLAGSGQTFSDVSPDYWAYLQIEAAYRGNIVSGYADGTYKPETVVTRDQMAVFIARAVAGGDANVPAGPGTASFSDVPTSNWAFKYIEYCKTRGIVGGYSDNTYHPTEAVTRDQMAVFIAKAVAGSDEAIPAGPETPTFPDVPTSNWAYKYIEYLSSQGIIGGYPDGTYHPTEQVTRAQMAVFITNAFDLISTALVANISGSVTTNTGVKLANGYLVLDDGDVIVQIDSDGNYTSSGLDPGTHEVRIFDQNGVEYEAKETDGSINANIHQVNLNFGNQQINFTNLQTL